MKMSEKMAVRLHRMMWSDMQKELGDRPSGNDRLKFKREWVERNFPGEHIASDCWLCEYVSSVVNRKGGDPYCKYCPIKWPNCHCNTLDFSYAKEPISEILALPAKNESIAKKAANIHDLSRDTVVGEVAKASGLPVECDIWSHIKKIQDKAQDSGFKVAKNELSVNSGLNVDATLWEHIRVIQEKAVEEYFAKTPGAKLATMDVDQAFKQYADEQKAPIFHALAEASGLSAGNESVKAHISLIRDTAKQNGRMEKCKEVFDELSESSGLSKGNWCLNAHVKAIQERAKKQMEPYVKSSTLLLDTLNKYKDYLSDESGLDRNRPVAYHITKIRDDAFSNGRNAERDRIQSKIEELLS